MPIFIGLCETWLTVNDPLGSYQNEGYKPILSKPRKTENWGLWHFT